MFPIEETAMGIHDEKHEHAYSAYDKLVNIVNNHCGRLLTRAALLDCRAVVKAEDVIAVPVTPANVAAPLAASDDAAAALVTQLRSLLVIHTQSRLYSGCWSDWSRHR